MPGEKRERPQYSRRIGSMVKLEPVGLRNLSLVKVIGGCGEKISIISLR